MIILPIKIILILILDIIQTILQESINFTPYDLLHLDFTILVLLLIEAIILTADVKSNNQVSLLI